MKMAKEKTSRLGTGLSALFGEEENVLENETVQTLPISRVEPRKDQPRREFDPAAIEELAASIREYGLIQPITVRPLDKGYYQIIAGERRWRAARQAGLSEIPAMVKEISEEKAMEIALIENLQREDLDPVEEALGYRQLMDRCGYTQEAAAAKLGKSRSAVANSLRLLNLPAPVLELLKSGVLSTGHAKALLSLPDAGRQGQAAAMVAEKGLSVRETERLAKKAEETPKPKQLAIDYLADFERRLSSHFGRKVGIQQKGKRGKLTIEYADADDLDALLRALGYEAEE